jgi:UDP-2,3-diacylglucosamine pyrophosphatase LpxH
MLVFLSDLHLTDGISGETISSGAFEKFTRHVKNLADSAGAKELEIVFLGDIFDLIRSDHWLTSTIRPWSGETDVDNQGKGLKDYSIEILRRIVENKTNKTSQDRLISFKKSMSAAGVQVKFTYLAGNHDWLVNRYPETRVMAASFFEMNNAEDYRQTQFATEAFFKDYKVFARHGDTFDSLNRHDDGNASSIGDAIVIELVNKFPRRVEKWLQTNNEHQLVSLLKEIDNVRPLWDVFLWIRGACKIARSRDTEDNVKHVWNRTVDDFFKNDFGRYFSGLRWVILAAGLKFLFKFSMLPLFLSRFLNQLKARIIKLLRKDDDYDTKAFSEKLLRNNDAEYVVFGHTHFHKIQPLDRVVKNGRVLNKTYFNTGTWRKVHVKAEYSKSNDFSSWDVMTFIAFYLEHERPRRKFEVWNGALG